MKKVVSLALSALLALSLAACSSSNTTSTAASSAATSMLHPPRKAPATLQRVLQVVLPIMQRLNPTSSSMRVSSHRRLPTTIPVPSSCRTWVMMTAMATTGPLISKIKRMTKLFALSQAARP